ncbi:MAG: VOC family protein [Burkholderiaceae bacterium]
MKMNPYLTFDGNCADAMRFYQKTFGGQLEMMTFDSSPMRDDIPKGHGDKIVHACLTVDGQSLMASDTGPWAPFEGIKGISVTLNYPTAATARPIFDALADQGKVTMPLQKTFWAEAFGMVNDRFGTPWMVNAGTADAATGQKTGARTTADVQ